MAALIQPIAQQQEQIAKQQEQVYKLKEQRQSLRDEVARLKRNKGKPKVPPSKLNDGKRNKAKQRKGKRPGSAKRSKTAELKIHRTVDVPPPDVPEGAPVQGV